MSFWDGVQRFAQTAPPSGSRLDNRGHRITDDEAAKTQRQAEAIGRLTGRPESKPKKERKR